LALLAFEAKINGLAGYADSGTIEPEIAFSPEFQPLFLFLFIQLFSESL